MRSLLISTAAFGSSSAIRRHEVPFWAFCRVTLILPRPSETPRKSGQPGIWPSFSANSKPPLTGQMSFQ